MLNFGTGDLVIVEIENFILQLPLAVLAKTMLGKWAKKCTHVKYMVLCSVNANTSSNQEPLK